jgi:hypothetical protein
MRRRWLSIVFSERSSIAAASAFDAPALMRPITWISRSDGRRGADRTDLTAVALNAVPPAATTLIAARISSMSAVFTRYPAAPRSNAARISDGWSKADRMITAGTSEPPFA